MCLPVSSLSILSERTQQGAVKLQVGITLLETPCPTSAGPNKGAERKVRIVDGSIVPHPLTVP